MCCYEYWGTCAFSNYGFLWIYAQEWNCRIIYFQLYFQFLKGPPYCSPQWLYQFTFPPTVQEFSLFFTPFPAFIICRLFNDGYSDWCKVTTHVAFIYIYLIISNAVTPAFLKAGSQLATSALQTTPKLSCLNRKYLLWLVSVWISQVVILVSAGLMCWVSSVGKVNSSGDLGWSVSHAWGWLVIVDMGWPWLEQVGFPSHVLLSSRSQPGMFTCAIKVLRMQSGNRKASWCLGSKLTILPHGMGRNKSGCSGSSVGKKPSVFQGRGYIVTQQRHELRKGITGATCAINLLQIATLKVLENPGFPQYLCHNSCL